MPSYEATRNTAASWGAPSDSKVIMDVTKKPKKCIKPSTRACRALDKVVMYVFLLSKALTILLVSK